MALFGHKKKQINEEVTPEPKATMPPRPEPNADGLQDLEQHRDYLIKMVKSLKPFGMKLIDAWDQTLCEDIVALNNVPEVAKSAILGYAVSTKDLLSDGISRLELVDGDELPLNSAIVVAQGAPMPEGADAVVPASELQVMDGKVIINKTVSSGMNVIPVGAEIEVGTQLIERGRILNARNVGLLAAAGIDKVLVRPQPRVVVMSVGDNLAEPDDPASVIKDLDSNSYLISTAAKAFGAKVWRVGVVSTEKDKLKDAIIDQLIRADLLLITPGRNKKDFKIVHEIINDIGVADHADVAIEPGGSISFGLIGYDNVPVMVLGPDSLSAIVGFQAFVVPVIRKLSDISPYKIASKRALTSKLLRPSPYRMKFLPGIASVEHGLRVVKPVEEKSVSVQLARANALILLPKGNTPINANDSVRCWMLDPER